MTELLGEARAAPAARFLIVAAKFNRWITDRLVDGAVEAFKAAGVGDDRLDIARVPGSFELPQAALAAAKTGRYAAIACLGAVIRGETSHDKHVAESAARGIEDVGVATGVPVTLGVITADTVEQAQARSQPGGGRNMGADAARAAVEMASLAAKLKAGT